jgi:hypothetical protein
VFVGRPPTHRCHFIPRVQLPILPPLDPRRDDGSVREAGQVPGHPHLAHEPEKPGVEPHPQEDVPVLPHRRREFPLSPDGERGHPPDCQHGVGAQRHHAAVGEVRPHPRLHRPDRGAVGGMPLRQEAPVQVLGLPQLRHLGAQHRPRTQVQHGRQPVHVQRGREAVRECGSQQGGGPTERVRAEHHDRRAVLVLRRVIYLDTVSDQILCDNNVNRKVIPF